MKSIVARHPARPLLLAALAALALAGCERNPLLVKRSACPAVAVPAYAGDVTLFRGDVQDAGNIDVVAAVTNLRTDCAETPDQFVSRLNFDVVARRSDSAEARQVQFPLFIAVVQAGNIISAKQLTSVTVNFPAGRDRAVASGSASASVSRKAAAVSPAVMAKINRKRRVGDLDAATDPMADPEVKAALRAATFEVLVGFQLDERALAYNVAK